MAKIEKPGSKPKVKPDDKPSKGGGGSMKPSRPGRPARPKRPGTKPTKG